MRAAHRRVAQTQALGRAPGRGGHPAVLTPAGDAPGRGRAARGAAPRADAHVVDRVLAYRRLAQGGLTAAAVARRVRRSKGHVSILLRLGAAVDGMEPAEVAALRTPAVTWRLVQRLVRGDTRTQTPGERTAAVVALRRALRDAVAGFSSHTVDRRRQRRGRTPGAPALERFDPGAFAADPAGYVAGHVERLVAAHEALARQALRMLDRALAAERLAAVPLSALARMTRAQLAAVATRGRAHLTAEQQLAVDALEATSRVLGQLVGVAAAARGAAAEGATGATARRDAAHPAPQGPAAPDGVADPITADEVEADLAD